MEGVLVHGYAIWGGQDVVDLVCEVKGVEKRIVRRASTRMRSRGDSLGKIEVDTKRHLHGIRVISLLPNVRHWCVYHCSVSQRTRCHRPPSITDQQPR